MCVIAQKNAKLTFMFIDVTNFNSQFMVIGGNEPPEKIQTDQKDRNNA